MIKKEVAQKLFDTVAKNLIKQGVLCFELDTCRYELNGKRCAIGWLLQTEEQIQLARYVKGGVERLIDIAKERGVELPRDLTNKNHREFLSELQLAHDSYSIQFINDEKAWLPIFINRMENIALKYGLNMEILRKERRLE